MPCSVAIRAANIKRDSTKEPEMRVVTKKTIASLVALSLACGTLPLTAQAAPAVLGAAGTSKAEKQTLVEPVHRRRHHHHGGRGAAALLGGIVAGALIAGAIQEGRASEYDMDRCADDFRSFDPRTGTIINRYGEEVVCPYLR
jgi:hypothetical protein